MDVRRQMRVIKADGQTEEYFHTKVVGAISNALGGAGYGDIRTAEELAEAVTYYLYQGRRRGSVSSGEILSMVQAVLSSTGHDDAAVVLSEHHYTRKLQRCRVEVVAADVAELCDAEMCFGLGEYTRRRWDKSRIVTDLIAEQGVGYQAARAIASMVEEKVFSLGLTVISTSLIRQLVLSDTAAVLRAQRELATMH